MVFDDDGASCLRLFYGVLFAAADEEETSSQLGTTGPQQCTAHGNSWYHTVKSKR